MDSKETIIQTTIKLIEEKGERIDEITVREICSKAGVGLGLLNYHFGNKENLITVCVERIINGIVEQFQHIGEQTIGLAPIKKLEALGNLTLDFLFAHYAVSRISILTDMQTPNSKDNTSRTYAAYLPLVAACRPDLTEDAIKRKTFCLITVMQQTFLRQEAISQLLSIDLQEKEVRDAFHAQILHDILEI